MLIGLALFSLAVLVNYWANTYAQAAGQNAVTDIVLNNVPVVNVDFVMTYGVMMVIVFVVWLLLVQPHRLPFALKSLSFFILVRSVFISVTHIAQFSPQAPLDPGPFLNFIGSSNTGGLFFSGHTGIPFLLALMFWDSPRLRVAFLGISVIFAASVLLGHLHYSIDVLGAFFVTYTICHLAVKFFPGDYALFQKTV